MSIKGHKSQQALQKRLSGLPESASIDFARYVTIQEMPLRRHALDVAIHGTFQITTSPLTIASTTIVTTAPYRFIVSTTPHGAMAADMIRLSNGSEFSVLSTPDAYTIVTSVELLVNPAADTFTVWRYITPSYNADGSLNTSQGPVEYLLNNVVTKVNRDTTTPANTNALPVEIMGANGVVLNVTAGDLNVEILHNGAAPSSVRIGDGTTLAAVSLANELHTIDSGAITALGTIHTDLVAVEANQATQIGHEASIDSKIPAQGQAVSAASLPVVLPAVQITALTPPPAITNYSLESGGHLSSIDTKLPAQGQALSSASTPVVLPASQITTLTPPAAITGFALDATVSAMSAKLPATLGQKTMANSMAVVLASDQFPLAVTTTGTDVLASGSISGTTTVAIATAGDSAASFQVLGSWTGSIVADGSIDGGTTWNTINILFTSNIIATSLSANNQGFINCVGYSNIRLRGATVTGTANITFRATVATGYVAISSPIPNGGNYIGSITNVNAITTALPAGTNLLGKVGIDQTTPGTTNLIQIAARSEAVATPLASRISDGTNFLSSIALAAAQLTSGALTAIRMSAAVSLGWDGTTHREMAVDTSGNCKTVNSATVGTITQTQATVGITAVRATVSGSAATATRKKLMVKPVSANTGRIFIGASTVTTANGLEIIGPDRLDFILDGSDYWLISDTAAQVVSLVEVI